MGRTAVRHHGRYEKTMKACGHNEAKLEVEARHFDGSRLAVGWGSEIVSSMEDAEVQYLYNLSFDQTTTTFLPIATLIISPLQHH